LAEHFGEIEPFVRVINKASDVILRSDLDSLDEVMRPERRLAILYLSVGLIYVEPPEDFDFRLALERVKGELADAENHRDRYNKRLQNEDFMSKASAEARREAQDGYEQQGIRAHFLQEQVEQLQSLVSA